MFGDGTVILRSTPGHTPGHQSPYVKLAKTGGVLLSADAYHYRQSCTLQRVPKFDSNQEQSRATRAMVEELLRKNWNGTLDPARLLREHEAQKAPAYYD